MIRWNDWIEATRLSWPSITPFGVPVVPEVKISSKSSSGAGRGQAATWASQSGGNEASGSAAMASIVVVGNASRPASRGSGASRPVAEQQARGPGFGDDALDRLGGHPEIERHEDQTSANGSEIGRRQLGRRGRPREHAIARLEAERAEPPGRDPGATVELAVCPLLGRAVIAPDPDRRSIGEASNGIIEQVEQRFQLA